MTLCIALAEYENDEGDVRKCFLQLSRIAKREGLIIISTVNVESLLRKEYSLAENRAGADYQPTFL